MHDHESIFVEGGVKCPTCGDAMRSSTSDHPYLECGLAHVVLVDVTHHRCARDDVRLVEFERIARLQRLLAEDIFVNKPARLLPSEVRFLRDHLELSNRDFARVFGVTESQSSRWASSEHPEQMSLAAEHLLRALASLGSIELETSEAGTTKIVASRIAIEIELPPRDAVQEALPVRLKFVKAKRDWVVVEPSAR